MTRRFYPVIFPLWKNEENTRPYDSQHRKYSSEENETCNNIRYEFLKRIGLKRIDSRQFQAFHKERRKGMLCFIF